MAEHPSALVLDELTAGLPVEAGAKSHAESCAECRARLQRLAADRARVIASSRYQHVLAALTERASSADAPANLSKTERAAPLLRARRWRWAVALAPALAAAAGLVLILRGPSEEPSSLSGIKGAATVRLVEASSGTPRSVVRVGEQVRLSLGGGAGPSGWCWRWRRQARSSSCGRRRALGAGASQQVRTSRSPPPSR